MSERLDLSETERFVRETLTKVGQPPNEKTVAEVAFKIDKAFRFLVKGDRARRENGT